MGSLLNMNRTITFFLLPIILQGCFSGESGLNAGLLNNQIPMDSTYFDNFRIIELTEDDRFFNATNDASILFSKVTNDSRCPRNTECIDEGEVSVQLDIHEENSLIFTSELTIPGEGNFFNYKNTFVRLLHVDPYPTLENTSFEKHTITLEIRPEASDCQSLIIDPDLFSNPWDDPYIIEAVIIKDENILININYGGGCGDIHYELVTNGHTADSSPEVIDLVLSFNDEDHCEALISSTLCFDLFILQKITSDNRIFLRIMGWDNPIEYAY